MIICPWTVSSALPKRTPPSHLDWRGCDVARRTSRFSRRQISDPRIRGPRSSPRTGACDDQTPLASAVTAFQTISGITATQSEQRGQMMIGNHYSFENVDVESCRAIRHCRTRLGSHVCHRSFRTTFHPGLATRCPRVSDPHDYCVFCAADCCILYLRVALVQCPMILVGSRNNAACNLW